MKQRPFTSSVSVTDEILSEYGNHTVRQLSAMKRQYLDGQAYAAPAIALHLCNNPSAGNRLRHFVTVGRSQGRLDRLKQMFESVKTDIVFEYILNEDPMRTDAAWKHYHQRDGNGQRPAGFDDCRPRSHSDELNCVGSELLRRNRLYVSSAQTERDAQGSRRRRLVVLYCMAGRR